MKGKHQKKIPLFRKITAAVFITGIVMVVTAFALEARYIPWGKLFGTASQSEDSIPDPTPPSIVLSTLAPVTRNPQATPTTAAPESTEPSPEVTEEVEETPQLEHIGILKIPAINVSQNLYSGAGMDEMKYGVGHVTGTAMPGEKGNCAISGHRPYPFRYLDTLTEGDKVIVKRDGVVYTYSVYESFEVLPEETWVLDNIIGEKYTLTLITCTPYMVSSHRLIVRARLIDIDGMTPAEYYGEEEEEPPETDDGGQEGDGNGAPEDVPGQENEQSEAETGEPVNNEAPQDTDIPQETDAVWETEEPAETDVTQVTEVPPEAETPGEAEEPAADIPRETPQETAQQETGEDSAYPEAA